MTKHCDVLPHVLPVSKAQFLSLAWSGRPTSADLELSGNGSEQNVKHLWTQTFHNRLMDIFLPSWTQSTACTLFLYSRWSFLGKRFHTCKLSSWWKGVQRCISHTNKPKISTVWWNSWSSLVRGMKTVSCRCYYRWILGLNYLAPFHMITMHYYLTAFYTLWIYTV